MPSFWTHPASKKRPPRACGGVTDPAEGVTPPLPAQPAIASAATHARAPANRESLFIERINLILREWLGESPSRVWRPTFVARALNPRLARNRAQMSS